MQRCAYFPKGFLNKFTWIKFTVIDSTEIYDKGHVLKTNFSIVNILKILNTIFEHSEICLSRLLTKSKIKMKKSCLKYLNFLLDLKFISKSKSKGRGNPVHFTLTKKGNLFLEMFNSA